MPRRTPPRVPTTLTAADERRAYGVVLEDIRSQLSLVLEATTSTKTELRAELRAMKAELAARISVLEDVVRQNSADIRQNTADIRQNTADIRALREEVARLRHDFDHREEIGRFSALETRVSAIESRLNISSR